MPFRALLVSLLCAGLLGALAIYGAHAQTMPNLSPTAPQYSGHAVTLTTLTDQPGNVAVDGQGNLYVVTNGLAHLTDAVVLELKRGSRKFTRVALFHDTEASSVWVDSSGDIFAQSDTAIEEVVHDSSMVTTIAPLLAGTGTNPPLFNSHGNIFAVTIRNSHTDFASSINEISAGTNKAVALLTLKDTLLSPLTADAAGDVFFSASTLDESGQTITTDYKILAGSHTATHLAAMPKKNSLDCIVSDSNGDLLGVAGSSSESIYELPHGSSSYIKIASFGALEPANLLLDSHSDIFGAETTAEPDSGKPGARIWSVFEIPAGTHQVKTLAKFTKSTPVALTMDSSGDIFGVTEGVSPDFVGTVFEIGANGHMFAPVPSPSPAEDALEENR